MSATSLRVLEPPPVAIIAQEVQTDVTFGDLELCDVRLSLGYLAQAVQECVDQLARLRFNVGLDAEHGEGLLNVLFLEDVRELAIDLHVEEDLLAPPKLKRAAALVSVLHTKSAIAVGVAPTATTATTAPVLAVADAANVATAAVVRRRRY
eukprot:CAMPEP_0170470570 /NCGR_PEP_ID=MMETSP0123-20130129/12991_1 /TAXON_ID=182087 /ORGANISM="Favella ehrenbergii, Strain Fehren 1" /LENGTH=150 /DNA_ID=CAMNT_0010737753 /DNA_START=78 /DNA_END=528 /DNA_ORIENTATION=+